MPSTISMAQIVARSRRQAMDWSLALLSQGIECVIEHPPETGQWELVVADSSYQSALECIQQYRLENRGWVRYQVPRSKLIFDWTSLAWMVLCVFFFWFGTLRDLQTPGLMDSQLVGKGQWWRLFTAVWLHADIAHLLANLTFGTIFLGLAMGQYGVGNALLAAYLAGGAGNALNLLARAPHLSLGASGLVMGALGLLATESFFTTRWRYVVAGGAAAVMLFVLLGLGPGTDVTAHAGGFLAGITFGLLLRLAGSAVHKTLPNLLSMLIFVVLILLPWWLALK